VISTQRTRPPKDAKCDIQISFGSYGSGTPHKVEAKIAALMNETKDISNIKSWAWGKEGEYDYCLDFKSESSMNKFHEKLLKIIPKKSKEGYTTLKRKGIETRKTVWPM